MASIPGIRFDVTGASGSQGLLGPKSSWKNYFLPRGAYASQDSSSTVITFDSASVASRFTAGDWIQVGTATSTIRQVGAVGGNSISVSVAVSVTKNDRILLIGRTEPTVSGGSATYTTPNTIIRQRDDDAAELYTNSMVTTNANGLVQSFGAPALFDVLVQDGNRTNQGILVDTPIGIVQGISVTDDAYFGSSVNITGNVTIGGTFSVANGPWNVLSADRFANGSTTGGLFEAYSALPAQGGTIRISAGTTYSIQTTIPITKPNVTIEGAGESSVLLLAVNSHMFGKQNQGIIGDNFRLSNLRLDGNKSVQTSGRGLNIGTANDVRVEDVTIVNTPDAAIGTNAYNAVGSSSCARLHVTNTRIVSPGRTGSADGYGIIINNATDAYVAGCRVSGSLASSIFGFNGGHRARIIGNIVEDSLDNGIRWGSTSGFPLADAWTVCDNQVHGCSVDGIRADGSSATVIGNASWGNSNSGIKIDGPCSNSILANNKCFNNNNKGIYLNNSNGNHSDIVIRGNLCKGNSGDGIQIAANLTGNSMARISIRGNECVGNSGFGLLVTSATAVGSIFIAGNIYNGNSAPEAFGSSGWTYEFTPSTAIGTTITTGQTVTIPTDGRVFNVTGTTTIQGLSTNPWDRGRTAKLIFASGTTLTSPLANAKIAGTYSVAANYSITLSNDGTRWNEDGRSANS